MKIEIISSELIRPSSPTPHALRDFKLSFIDEKIPPFFIPLILYYTCNEASGFKQPEMASRLKASLADALTDFYPLAGRISGQTSVDCNDEGVYFLVSRVDGVIQEILGSPEGEVVDNLIPYRSHGSTLIADEQLAIQVNLFRCGGIAIGICLSHRIADGSSLCSFIKSWAAKATGKSNLMISPVFNSASLFPARGTLDFRPNPKCVPVLPALETLVTKRFKFTAAAITGLKAKVIKHSSISQPTRVEVVSALLWKCWIAAKGLDKYGVSAACVPVNLRKKTVPQLMEHSFGNMFQVATALTSGETDWIGLVDTLRAAIKKIDGEYTTRLLGENGFEIHKKNFQVVNDLISQGIVKVIRFSTWCNFPLDKADFGWGKPCLVTSAGCASKDTILLFDSNSPGGVEAWVVMADHEMEKFQQQLLGLIKSLIISPSMNGD